MNSKVRKDEAERKATRQQKEERKEAEQWGKIERASKKREAENPSTPVKPIKPPAPVQEKSKRPSHEQKMRKDFQEGAKRGAARETTENEKIIYGNNQKAEAILRSMNQTAFEGVKSVLTENDTGTRTLNSVADKVSLTKTVYESHTNSNAKNVQGKLKDTCNEVVVRSCKHAANKTKYGDISFGVKKQTGAWNNEDGSNTKQYRKDEGVHVRKYIDPIGVESTSASEGKSTTTTSTNLDAENHKMSEESKSELIGLRASRDILGVEVEDLSCGREKFSVRGSEWKNNSKSGATTSSKTYVAEGERTKLLGVNISTKIDNARVNTNHESGRIFKARTSETKVLTADGKVVTETDRSICKVGFKKVETSEEGNWSSGRKDIECKEYGGARYELNGATKQAISTGVTTAATCVSAKNSAKFSDMQLLSKDTALELGEGVVKNVSVSLASTAAGDVIANATGCSALEGQVATAGRVLYDLKENGVKSAAMTGGRDLANQGVTAAAGVGIQEVERTDDGKLKRITITSVGGSQVGMGTRTKAGAGEAKDGTNWSQNREEAGVQIKAVIPNTYGASAINTNFGTCTEKRCEVKETGFTTTKKDTTEQVMGMSGQIEVLGFEVFDLKTGQNITTEVNSSQGLIFESENSVKATGVKVLGFQLTRRVNVESEKHRILGSVGVGQTINHGTGSTNNSLDLDFFELSVTYDGKALPSFGLTFSPEGQIVLGAAVSKGVVELSKRLEEKGDAFSTEDICEVVKSTVIPDIVSSFKNIMITRGVSLFTNFLQKNAKFPDWLNHSVGAAVRPIVNQIDRFCVKGTDGVCRSDMAHDWITQMLITGFHRVLIKAFPQAKVAVVLKTVITTTLLPAYAECRKAWNGKESKSVWSILCDVAPVIFQALVTELAEVMSADDFLPPGAGFFSAYVFVPLLVEFGPVIWEKFVEYVRWMAKKVRDGAAYAAKKIAQGVNYTAQKIEDGIMLYVTTVEKIFVAGYDACCGLIRSAKIILSRMKNKVEGMIAKLKAWITEKCGDFQIAIEGLAAGLAAGITYSFAAAAASSTVINITASNFVQCGFLQSVGAGAMVLEKAVLATSILNTAVSTGSSALALEGATLFAQSTTALYSRSAVTGGVGMLVAETTGAAAARATAISWLPMVSGVLMVGSVFKLGYDVLNLLDENAKRTAKVENAKKRMVDHIEKADRFGRNANFREIEYQERVLVHIKKNSHLRSSEILAIFV